MQPVRFKFLEPDCGTDTSLSWQDPMLLLLLSLLQRSSWKSSGKTLVKRHAGGTTVLTRLDRRGAARYSVSLSLRSGEGRAIGFVACDELGAKAW